MTAVTTAPIQLDVKEKCFNDYMEGFNLGTICERHGVNYKTLRTWVSKYGWVNKRSELWQIYTEKVNDRIKEKILECKKKSLSGYLSMCTVFEERAKALEKKILSGTYTNEEVKEIRTLSNMMDKIFKVQAIVGIEKEK